jgi:hypothetical protein
MEMKHQEDTALLQNKKPEISETLIFCVFTSA